MSDSTDSFFIALQARLATFREPSEQEASTSDFDISPDPDVDMFLGDEYYTSEVHFFIFEIFEHYIV